jgi:hypothetical protein
MFGSKPVSNNMTMDASLSPLGKNTKRKKEGAGGWRVYLELE